MLPVLGESRVENKREEIRLQLMEHAKSISRLADQVTDRRAKICLIGLAFKLLDSIEVVARSSDSKAA